jgi:hypothetical protein
VPVPDPTRLTTEQLHRELGSLREILEIRMNSMDHERQLLLQIMDERTAEIERRFADRDIRFDDRDKARQAAIIIALGAAKELSDAHDVATANATEKFEASVRVQLASLGQLAAANRDLLEGKIEALKERIDRGEGSTSGARSERTEQRAGHGESRLNQGTLISFALLAVAVISLILLYATKK